VGRARRVLGTIGLVIAGAAQPTLGEVADRYPRAAAELQDDTGVEWAWTAPVTGPVDMSDFVAGP
jgi:hypothetical protein